MLTTAVDDSDPQQRDQGRSAGLAMAATLQRRAFYLDRGWSEGMVLAREFYRSQGLSYEERRLGGLWATDTGGPTHG
jgi:hypothetical protein